MAAIHVGFVHASVNLLSEHPEATMPVLIEAWNDSITPDIIIMIASLCFDTFRMRGQSATGKVDNFPRYVFFSEPGNRCQNHNRMHGMQSRRKIMTGAPRPVNPKAHPQQNILE